MSPSQPRSFSARPRPSDRVREYVLNLPEQNGQPQRLPTMRDLATHLGVSLATVHSVYQDLKKQGHISTRIGDGSYLLPVAPGPVAAAPKGARRRIYFNHIPMGDQQHLTLQGAYYSALLQQVMKHNLRYDFSVLDAEDAPQEEQILSLHQSGQLDGMIIFPFIPCQPIVEACERHGVPYVTLHPASPSAASNYVTPDYFEAGVRIARALMAGSRKRVALLTFGKVLGSATAWALAAGVANGFLELGRPVHLERASFRSVHELREHFGAWLDERKDALPDAILCHRYGFWSVVRELLEERGLRVPEDVALITTLQHETTIDSSSATRLVLPFIKVAQKALENLQAALEQGRPIIPSMKIDAFFAGGTTTRPEENTLLGI